MVKAISFPFVEILEYDGSRERFDALALQTRLIGCFLAAGRGDSSFMAEDIALAVEYTLSTIERPDPVFGRGELDAAVIRLLEEAGLPDVAKIFRQGPASTRLLVDAADSTLSELLQRHLACSPERFDKVLEQVISAAQKLDIRSASPHLWLELARHFEQEMAAEHPLVTEFSVDKTMTRDEIVELLSPEARQLIKEGVLRVNGVTTLFPCINFHFMICEFARMNQMTSPVLEMSIIPLLYQTGSILEAARAKINAEIDPEKELPCLLTIPDMLNFITTFMESSDHGAERIAAGLAEKLANSFNSPLFKLTFS